LASEYLGYLVDTEQLVERLVDKRMNEWMQQLREQNIGSEHETESKP
jgi:hypothetical protein